MSFNKPQMRSYLKINLWAELFFSSLAHCSVSRYWAPNALKNMFGGGPFLLYLVSSVPSKVNKNMDFPWVFTSDVNVWTCGVCLNVWMSNLLEDKRKFFSQLCLPSRWTLLLVAMNHHSVTFLQLSEKKKLFTCIYNKCFFCSHFMLVPY